LAATTFFEPIEFVRDKVSCLDVGTTTRLRSSYVVNIGMRLVGDRDGTGCAAVCRYWWFGEDVAVTMGFLIAWREDQRRMPGEGVREKRAKSIFF